MADGDANDNLESNSESSAEEDIEMLVNLQGLRIFRFQILILVIIQVQKIFLRFQRLQSFL